MSELRRQAIAATEAAWERFAEAKGLTLRPSSGSFGAEEEPRVGGDLDGVSVAFKLANMDGSWGVMAVGVPRAPLAVHLEVVREGMLEKIAKFFGAKDLILGDAAFDPQYLVRVTNDDAGRALLTPPVRRDMLSLGVRSLSYSDGSTGERSAILSFEIPRLLTEPRELEVMLGLIVAIAKVTPPVA